MSSFPDSILLPNLPLKAHLPDYAWSLNKKELKLQPLSVSIELHADLSKAGKTDDLNASVSYSDLTKIAQSHVAETSEFPGGIRQVGQQLLDQVEAASRKAFQRFQTCISVSQTKAIFKAQSLEFTIKRESANPSTQTEALCIRALEVDSLIGVNDFEKQQKQPLRIDAEAQLSSDAEWQPNEFVSLINTHNGNCQPALIETYLEQLAETCFKAFPLDRVTLSVAKPFASKFAGPPTVSITRRRSTHYLTSTLLPISLDKTLIMGIINLTPDSFGTPPSVFEESLREAKEQIESGVDILDLGGVSTRPGAADVSEEEETQRVIPFIKAIRQADWGKKITLSVDTFRAKVAKQALEAGADWINDVKAGVHDPDGAMWKVAKDTGAPIILMHSRGDAQTMNALAKYDGDLIKVIEAELSERIQDALTHGVKKWQIIVDPGIGFAKDAETNWQLMRRLSEWTKDGPLSEYPCLVGTSRKRFLGSLLNGVDPVKRDMATAATCVEAIRSGAHIVRVHNPAFVMDAIKVANKLYKHTTINKV